MSDKFIWTMSRSAWQHAQGIHQPHIGEISGVQLARMSKRARRVYDAKREREWDASSEAKQRYDRRVVEAHDAGEFAVGDATTHRDARAAVVASATRRAEAAQAAQWEGAQKDNVLSIDQVAVGDRVWLIIGGHYGTVIKKNKKSIRVKLETAYLANLPPRLVAMGGALVCRLSRDDLKAELAKGES